LASHNSCTLAKKKSGSSLIHPDDGLLLKEMSGSINEAAPYRMVSAIHGCALSLVGCR